MTNDKPLSAVAFEVLLSLANGERHGYEIMLDISNRSGLKVHPGTLYRAIGRLVDEGLLEELEERPASARGGPVDERRRYYQLTPQGREKARSEARRLEAQVHTARAKRLLGKSRA